MILNVLQDVKNTLSVLTPGPHGWAHQAFRGAPRFSTVCLGRRPGQDSDAYWMNVSDFLTPPSLYYGLVGGQPEKLKQTAAWFDASKLEVTQHFVTSKDGTRIPYFQVSQRGMALDDSHPTLLNGYGGFEVSEVPYYSGAYGRAWLSKGGVYVLANIRGGGEYGPRGHDAALKANRAVRLRGFCRGGRGSGGPWGHLLTWAASVAATAGFWWEHATMYPEDFAAIVCQVPLLDMKRFTHIGAGASWIAEYGNPDKPEEWASIQKFSPYQNVQKDVKYPPILFVTSTGDDRVEPVHARKMAARMLGFRRQRPVL